MVLAATRAFEDGAAAKVQAIQKATEKATSRFAFGFKSLLFCVVGVSF